MIATLFQTSLAAALLVPQAAPDDVEWARKAVPSFGIKWNAGLSRVPSQQHQILWFGGINFITMFAETWTFDGEQWTRHFVNGPDARCHQYQTEFRDDVLLFGGETDALNPDRRDDTWLFDGSSWTELSPATSPSRRCCGIMVYDPAKDVAVLFGGVDQNLNWLNDTWEFDGQDWQQVASDGPPPRSNAGAAYDKQRGVIVLFGGIAPGGEFLGDTWEWDGNTWSEVLVPTPPSNRWAPAMNYHDELERVVLYGGESNGFDIRDDTWVFDGFDWTELDVSGPEPRVEAHLAYDESRGTLVLAGGFTFDADNVTDTWELQCVSNATDLGFGKVSGSGFFPEFTFCGELGTGSSSEWRVRQAPPNTFGFLLLSLENQPINVLGGTIVPADAILLGPFFTDPDGSTTLAFQGGLGISDELFAQWLFQDPLASFGIGISNSLEVPMLP